MKRAISLILAVIICSTLLPKQTFAATTPSNVSTEEALNKIYQLYNILGDGSYFTVNQKTCCETRESGHGCANCSLASIVEQSWFKDKFGTLSTAQFPRTYYSDTKSWSPSGRSCFAFATFAEWYIYSNAKTDKVSTQCVGTFNYDYEGVSKNIRTGDLIRLQDSKGSTSGHSAIVISYDSTGVKVLDSNGTGKNCEVHIRTIKYSKYNYYVISRAANSVNSNSQSGEQSISCVLTDPAEGEKIPQGKHPVAGTVISNNYPLQEVKAYLDGNCFATVTLGSAYTLDIRSSEINDKLVYGDLSLGEHTLVIKARDTKHSDYATLITRKFIITDSNGNTGSDSCSCSTSYAGYYLCTTTGTNLYIRSGHGSSYSAVGNVTKGAVAYIDKASGTGSNDWGHVTFNGVSGYCSMQYMKKLSTYTVSYNANGGSGAPSSQTKIQDVPLTLSSTKPTRSGYTFLGWATSSSATSASYSAGGSYTGNGNVTLYAVWKSNACSHSYSSSVTKAATCSTAGVRTYTCSKCGNSYTETIAATGNHVYGSWTTEKAASCTAAGTQQRKCNTCSKTESKTVSATGHDYKSVTSIATCTKPEETTYTCRNCNYSYSEKTGTQTAPHKWDNGKITTSATCAKEGVKTYTCTVCKQTKTEKLAKTDSHQFGDWTHSKTDHARTCSVCGEKETGQHDYYDEWFIDESCHYSVCKICDVHRGTAHRSDTDATETEPQVCAGCGYIMAPALGHTHHWQEELSYDRYTHWYACEGCSEKKDVESHAYQDICDELCDLCGFVYETTHLFYDGWDSDSDNHWHKCTCGKIIDVGTHTWEDGRCAVCDMEQPGDSVEPFPDIQPSDDGQTSPDIQPDDSDEVYPDSQPDGNDNTENDEQSKDKEDLSILQKVVNYLTKLFAEIGNQIGSIFKTFSAFFEKLG